MDGFCDAMVHSCIEGCGHACMYSLCSYALTDCQVVGCMHYLVICIKTIIYACVISVYMACADCVCTNKFLVRCIVYECNVCTSAISIWWWMDV